jgi:hypothetical protein
MDTLFTPLSQQFPELTSITANSVGDYWLTGGSLPEDSVYYQGVELTTEGDLFLVRFDSNHDLAWEVRGVSLGGGFGKGNSVAIDEDDNVYLGGQFGYGLAFGSDTLYGVGTGYKPFIAKFDTNGDLIWNTQIHSPGLTSSGSITSVECDAQGNIFFGGNFSGSMVVQDDTITSWGYNDNFWGKMTSIGDLAWIKAAGSEFIERGVSVAVDEVGDMYVFGQVVNSSNTDSVYVDTNTNYNNFGFIAKYSSSGTQNWLKGTSSGGISIGNPIYDRKIAVKNGVLAVTGEMHLVGDSLMEIAGVQYEMEGVDRETFILALDTTGVGLWLNGMTNYNGGINSGIAVEILDNGDIVVIVDHALFVGPVQLYSLIPLYLSIDGNTGVILSYCYASQFEHWPLPRAMTSFGNEVLVSGVFGDAIELIGGIFVSGLNTTVTSLNELSHNEDLISLFPNPATDQVYLELDQSLLPLRRVEIFDIQGREVFQKRIGLGETGVYSINVGHLGSGLYFLNVISTEGSVSTKILAIHD